MNQSLKDIEIILVDDGSPDKCSFICDSYAKQDIRIKVVHKQNEGLGFARNTGLDIATGEFVAFVDSDDYVNVNMFENLYNLSKELSLDTLFCGYNIVDKCAKETVIQEVSSFKIFDNKDQISGVLLDMIGSKPSERRDRKYQMSVWHAIYSLSIIKNNNIQFVSERKVNSEDIIFHIDYLQNALRIGFTPSAFYYYCSNEGSLTSSYCSDRFDRYKLLYSTILNKFSSIDLINECKLRAIRLFIGHTRSLIFDVENYKILSHQKKLNLICICNDQVWGDIFISYPYKELPFNYWLIVILIKTSSINSLIAISKMNSLWRIIKTELELKTKIFKL